MIEIPVGLPAELVPLSWLLGVWEGTGLVEYEVGDERSQQVGQLMKLDPRRPQDPLVWSLPFHDARVAKAASATTPRPPATNIK